MYKILFGSKYTLTQFNIVSATKNCNKLEPHSHS